MSSTDQAEPATGPNQPKYDFYQSEGTVTVTVMVKGVQNDHLKVEFQPRRLLVEVNQPGKECKLDIELFDEVESENCSFKLKSTKIELKLAKKSALFWKSLQKPLQVATKPLDTLPPSYSSKKVVNWDEFCKAEEEEPQGEQALNNLFQNIYKNADDATRKAMNKSFTESNGTVLSTNWGEIGSKKTDVKPPDGMEYRKWDE